MDKYCMEENKKYLEENYKKWGAVMSGDLISREDLLGTEQLLMTNTVKNSPPARYVLEQVLYDIENTKTAYDVGKIVEQLKNLKTYKLNIADAMSEIMCRGELGNYVCLEDVLEIVKSGGVADD